MSTRSIIEINHDYLRDLHAEEVWDWLERKLRTGTGEVPPTPMLRVLGQRHHSDPEWHAPKRPPGVDATTVRLRELMQRAALPPLKLFNAGRGKTLEVQDGAEKSIVHWTSFDYLDWPRERKLAFARLLILLLNELPELLDRLEAAPLTAPSPP